LRPEKVKRPCLPLNREVRKNPQRPAASLLRALVWAAAAMLCAACAGHSPSAPAAVPVASRLLPDVQSARQAPLIGFVAEPDGSHVASVPATYLFGLNSAVLLPTAVTELRNLLPAIRGSSGPVLILGWTDGLGTVARNDILSRQRAESVAAWLVSNKVSPRRIKAAGMGEATSKIDPPQRRVEVILK
jgi:OmpA-OmpF porin, OOP family